MSVLHIKDLSVYYANTRALVGVNLDIEEGEYLGIIGPNGGGKSTLLKAILGLVSPTTGEIKIYGKSPGHTGTRLGYVPQLVSLDKSFPLTVEQVVLQGRLRPQLTLFHRYRAEDRERVKEVLKQVGIYKLRERMLSELSGGEFQKMLIARALAVNPKMLLLDEPTASVDAEARKQIYQLLQELNKTMTIILVTHDLMAVSSHVRTLACMNGRLVYHGGPQINEGVIGELYGCPIDLIAHGVPHRVLANVAEVKQDDARSI
ncbi:MAG: ABC transporter [Firmicutes bacterium HGW-Firmicutes-12]|nr:MAG: ABC transporter [Firmicutes bacterium HGW-Firmicutes-12]